MRSGHRHHSGKGDERKVPSLLLFPGGALFFRAEPSERALVGAGNPMWALKGLAEGQRERVEGPPEEGSPPVPFRMNNKASRQERPCISGDE